MTSEDYQRVCKDWENLCLIFWGIGSVIMAASWIIGRIALTLVVKQ